MGNGDIFLDIWKKFVEPTFKTCYSEIDENFAFRCSINPSNSKEYLEQIKVLYERKFKWLTREYRIDNNMNSLDLIMIASIICRCIIGYKPMSYNQKAAEQMHIQQKKNKSISKETLIHWRINNIYVNYKMAFLSSLSFVKESLKGCAEQQIKKCDEEIIPLYDEFITLLNNMDLYTYMKSKNNFLDIDSIIISLVYQDTLKRDFDYLLYANVLYLIQEHIKSDMIIEIHKKYPDKPFLF